MLHNDFWFNIKFCEMNPEIFETLYLLHTKKKGKLIFAIANIFY